jgi:hypothetical protein
MVFVGCGRTEQRVDEKGRRRFSLLRELCRAIIYSTKIEIM